MDESTTPSEYSPQNFTAKDLSQTNKSSQETGKGLLGGHEIHHYISEEAKGLPKDLASEVFTSLKANDYKTASEIISQFKQFEKNPEFFSRQIGELLGGAKFTVEQQQTKRSSPERRHLLSAIEKIELSLVKKNKGKSSLFIMKGASLINKIAHIHENLDEIIAELAITSLPQSMNFILESAWISLLGEKKHISIGGITFMKKSFFCLLQALKKNAVLISLSLSACKTLEEDGEKKMADDAAKDIGNILYNHTSLRRFLFRNNRLSEKGAQSLAKLTNILYSLDLSDNGMNDTCIEALEESLQKPEAHLRELLLNRNKIQNKGAIIFAKILENNKNLRQLGLWGNWMDLSGVLALANVLNERNFTLERIDVGDNLLDPSSLEKVLSMRNLRLTL